MSTEEEVDKFYTENYNRLINYVKNGKKGGDKRGLVPDEAVEVLHDTYCYHKANPHHFSGKYIWNILKQRRLNHLRDKDNYDSMKEDFYSNYYSSLDWNRDEDLVSNLIIEETKGLIRQEISEVRNEKHKAILKSNILDDVPISDEDNSKAKVVQRFRTKLADKYGEKEDG